MKTFLVILAIVVLVIAAVLLYASTKPDVFSVRRSIVINASAAKIFPLINEFRNWSAWSPYEHRDPDMKRGYAGPPSGKGAVYTWEGNSKVGSGRIEIAGTEPPSKVAIKLDMLKPFEAHNDVAFTLVPEGAATRVTWAMTGPVPYLAKIMHVFMNMDKMVGGDFEAGLAKMKAVAEK